ncbi:MAG: hypothetical protein ACSW8H_00045 [bacterium]
MIAGTIIVAQMEWMKLHYKMLNWEWIGCPDTVALWVNLLLRAKQRTVRANGITCRRGQVVTSRSQLARECGLSERKIRTSLKRLISTKQVTVSSTNKATIITICNFDAYQAQAPDKRPAERPKERRKNDQQPHTATSKAPSIPISPSSKGKHNNIEEKKETTPYGVIEKEDEPSSPLSLRSKKFAETLKPFSEKEGGKYPREMLVAFYRYWTEPNRSKTKMRFELEKTWDVARRLNYWASRETVPSSGPKGERKVGKVEETLRALAESGVDITQPTELL